MNRREAADLDRHITGNYGEDSVPLSAHARAHGPALQRIAAVMDERKKMIEDALALCRTANEQAAQFRDQRNELAAALRDLLEHSTGRGRDYEMAVLRCEQALDGGK